MAEAYRFRKALRGFHKKDVAAYIERTTTEHRAELFEREQTIARLREEIAALQQQVEQLTSAPPAPEPSQLMELELQAYRRAERAERNAHKRVRKLYQQAEQAYDGAMEEFQVSDTAVRETIARMMEQARALEESYQKLSGVLHSSREKLTAMTGLLDEEDPE